MAGKRFGSLPTYNGVNVVLDNDARLAASSSHTVRTLIDFGHSAGGSDTINTTTVAATWVTATSTILCKPAAVATADHGAYDAGAENLWAYAANIVAGVSFDLITVAPTGTWGKYYIDAVSF